STIAGRARSLTWHPERRTHSSDEGRLGARIRVVSARLAELPGVDPPLSQSLARKQADLRLVRRAAKLHVWCAVNRRRRTPSSGSPKRSTRTLRSGEFRMPIRRWKVRASG